MALGTLQILLFEIRTRKHVWNFMTEDDSSFYRFRKKGESFVNWVFE